MSPDPRSHDTILHFPGQELLGSKKIVDALTAASRALAELNGSIKQTPDRPILVGTIPWQEAQASCGIENIVASEDELYRAVTAKDGTVDADVREVVRYRAAMHYAASSSEISIEMIEGICSVLKQEEIQIRAPGEQVYLKNSADGTIVFTPPEGSDVRTLLEGLIDYMGSDPIDPLIRMCISHALFETIHPFMDGNGRTGRILNVLILIQNGLLEGPDLFLSRFLMENRRDYYRLLRMVQRDRDNASWERWIVFMLNGVTEMSGRTLAQIRDIRDLYRSTLSMCEDVPGCTPALMDILFSRVYCETRFLVDAGIAERNTASRYLHALEERGILESEKVGREIIYKNTGLISILNR